jgi:hypothetical protein
VMPLIISCVSPKVQIEGLRAFAQSRSAEGL